jgi:hypothetical protein
MRKVPIKRVREDDEETYADVFILFLRGPENGQNVPFDEMRRVVPIIEVLEAAKVPEVGSAYVYLEEAQWELLRDRLIAPNAGFRRNEREALDMVNAVLNAEEYDPNEGLQTSGEDTSLPDAAEG